MWTGYTFRSAISCIRANIIWGIVFTPVSLALPSSCCRSSAESRKNERRFRAIYAQLHRLQIAIFCTKKNVGETNVLLLTVLPDNRVAFAHCQCIRMAICTFVRPFTAPAIVISSLGGLVYGKEALSARDIYRGRMLRRVLKPQLGHLRYVTSHSTEQVH